jgi:hypothetical protein
MTYTPKNLSEAEQVANQKLDSLFSNMRRAVSAHVEPGDTVFIEVSKNVEEKMLTTMAKNLEHIFKENKVILVEEGFIKDIKVLKQEKKE